MPGAFGSTYACELRWREWPSGLIPAPPSNTIPEPGRRRQARPFLRDGKSPKTETMAPKDEAKVGMELSREVYQKG